MISMYFKSLSIVILVLFPNATLFAKESINRETAEDKNCTNISFSGHPNSPPFSWNQHKQLQGAHVELAQLLGHDLNIPIEILFSGHWKRVQARVASGDIDVIMGLYKNTPREKLFDYTGPIFDDYVVVVSLQTTNLVYSGAWEDLKYYRGANILGESQGEKFDAFMKSSLHIEKPPTLKSMIKLLTHGRVDYGIHSVHPVSNALYLLRLENLIQVHTIPISTEPLYFAFSKKSKCKHLVGPVSKLIEGYKKAGITQMLLQKYKNLWKRENKPLRARSEAALPY